MDADVCVVDLTGDNPNVMYELAIAHAADKPTVLLKQKEEGHGSFDIKDEHVITYGLIADEAAAAREELKDQLEQLTSEFNDRRMTNALNPVRKIFRDMQTLSTAQHTGDDGIRDVLVQVLERLDAIENRTRRAEMAVVSRPHKMPDSRRRARDLEREAELLEVAGLLDEALPGQHLRLDEASRQIRVHVDPDFPNASGRLERVLRRLHSSAAVHRSSAMKAMESRQTRWHFR